MHSEHRRRILGQTIENSHTNIIEEYWLNVEKVRPIQGQEPFRIVYAQDYEGSMAKCIIDKTLKRYNKVFRKC